MSCPYGPEDLSAYVDGEVDEPTRRAIREHLRACADCRGVTSDLTIVSQALRRTPPAEPTDQTPWLTQQLTGEPVRTLHCTAVLAEGSAYIDGELAEEDVPALLAHLAQCDNCYGAHKELERVSEALTATSRAPVPAGLEQQVLAAVEADRAKVLGHIFRRLTEVGTPAARIAVRIAAAAVFVLALTWAVYQYSDPATRLPGQSTPRAMTASHEGRAVVSGTGVAEAPVPVAADEPEPVEASPLPGRPGMFVSRPTGGTSSATHAPAPEPRPIERPPVEPRVPDGAPEASTVVFPRVPDDALPVVGPATTDATATGPMLASARAPQSPGGGPAGDSRPATSLPKRAAPEQPLAATGPGSGTYVAELRDPETTPEVNYRSPRARRVPAAMTSSGVDMEALRAFERKANRDLEAESASQQPSFAIHP